MREIPLRSDSDDEVRRFLAHPTGSFLRPMPTPFQRDPENPERWARPAIGKGYCDTNYRYEQVRDRKTRKVISERTYYIPRDEWLLSISPHGSPGDRLWVRETWAMHWMWHGVKLAEVFHDDESCIFYRAGGPSLGGCLDSQRQKSWRPKTSMPRWAARLILENVQTDIVVKESRWYYLVHYKRVDA